MQQTILKKPYHSENQYIFNYFNTASVQKYRKTASFIKTPHSHC